MSLKQKAEYHNQILKLFFISLLVVVFVYFLILINLNDDISGLVVGMCIYLSISMYLNKQYLVELLDFLNIKLQKGIEKNEFN